uniref:Si:dkey-57a22.13 n=1 Tax=Cyprinodon variegatus TaxID=28743 RepID=A0A3Q2DE47_CYPVA
MSSKVRGHSYECDTDCPDMHTHFTRCNSIKVESGCWVLYGKHNYTGHQRRVPWLPVTFALYAYRLRIYERANFQGQMLEFSEDCESVQEQFRARDIYSCKVLGGYWTLYDHPNFRGRQYFLSPGEYRKISSFRRITEL